MSSARPGPTARELAFELIKRVTDDGAYSNLALAGALARSNLSARDRRLTADLTYGTIRKLRVLDHALRPLASRSLGSLDASTRAALRLGAYQVLFTRIPPHAAVGESVALAAPRARGFVNAVLRRLTREPPAPIEGDDDEAISGRTGLVTWAVAELRGLLPEGEIEPAAAALATPASLSLRVNRCRTTPEDLVAALADKAYEAAPGRHHPDTLHVASANPSQLPGYEHGWFAVQDEASVLVTAALDVRAGERVLDACAGPGGKAAHIGCLAGAGGLVVGADVSAARAGLVRSTAARLGVRIHTVVLDARHAALAPASFDAVLVDAPCSGLGAARRRPELLWRPAIDRLPVLASLQLEIMAGAADLVRPGGRLVYSVCTFTGAETDAIASAFVVSRPEFQPSEVPGPDGPAATHRLWPHRHGTDAMFYAGFVRAAGVAG